MRSYVLIVEVPDDLFLCSQNHLYVAELSDFKEEYKYVCWYFVEFLVEETLA